MTAVTSLSEQIRLAKVEEKDDLFSLIGEAKKILFESRETEPFMRNAVRYMEWKLRNENWREMDELQTLIQKILKEILEEFSNARRTITEIGSKRVLKNFTILTHCHSSAVTSVLLEAKKSGVDFQVICTETRPVYQGRITSRELVKAGIETIMIVDSAVRSFLKKADLVFVGADALTSEGNVINKIGTSQVALAAHEARVPFYVVSELLKFDQQTIYGEYEIIEERAASEIWDEAPKDLKIRNPAFDITRRDYIHGIICEEGIISPHSILEAVHRKYPWILEFPKQMV